VNDIERWINLKGPEPGGIRRLMDAGREASDLTPEQAARMERSFHQALAARKRKQARVRTAKWTAAGLLGVGAAAAAVVLVLPSPRVADAPGATVESATVGATALPATSAAAPQEQGADAGAPRARVKPRAR
jgi:hypothetical protein